jgi:polyisoprenoid-binding protein YceI
MRLDPGTSTVGFQGHKLTGSHEGRFNGISGTVVVDQGRLVMLSGEIELASVRTDKIKLDTHLMGEDFFDVANFPRATFETTSVEQGDGGYVITGDLDLHGVTEEVSFPATVSVGGQAVEIDAQFELDRQLWGVSYPGKPDDLIQDDVGITLDLTFTAGG